MKITPRSLILLAVVIGIVTLAIIYLTPEARADALSERIERLDVELAQKLQREPIELELKGPQAGGESSGDVNVTNVTNVTNNNVTNNYYHITNIVYNIYIRITNITNIYNYYHIKPLPVHPKPIPISPKKEIKAKVRITQSSEMVVKANTYKVAKKK